MNHFFRGIAVAAILFLFTHPVLGQGNDGQLDPSFNSLSKIHTPIGTKVDSASAVALDQGGGIVLAGSSFNGSDFDFALGLYTSDGNLNPGFGEGGKVTTNLLGDDIGRAVAIDRNGGNIVVAGSSNEDFSVVRYTAVGALDGSFGNGGIAKTDIGGRDAATAVSILSNGKILVAGISFEDNNTSYFTLVRYNSNGSLDESFGTGGIVKRMGTYTINSQTANAAAKWNTPSTLIVKDDGSIILTGTGFGATTFYAVMMQFNSDGTLNTGFGDGGNVLTDLNPSLETFVRAAALQSDGKIIIGGKSMGYPFVYRFDSNGALDPSFDSDGKLLVYYSATQVLGDVASIALQQDGKIILAGSAKNANNKFSFAAVRLNGSDGTLDATFSSDGKDITPIGGGTQDDICNGAAISMDGKIVMAGTYSGGGKKDFAVFRYNADGTIDNTNFGSYGKLRTMLYFGGDDRIMDAALMSDGKVLFVGTTYYDTQEFAFGRLDTSGQFASFFTDDHINFPQGPSVANAVAIQSDGKMVLAGKVTINGIDNFALARLDESGSLDGSFGSGGKVTSNETSALEAKAVAI